MLEDKSEITLWYFYTGLYCIVISSAFKAFIQYSFFNAVLVTAGLGGITYLLLQAGNRIINSMYVKKESAITGKITTDQINDPTNVRMN